MYDVVARLLTPDQIRDWCMISNAVSAVLIGAFLAYHNTQGAGVRCPLAFLRLVHRIVLVLFSLALMYNALFIYSSDRYPSGPALLINIGILISAIVSSIRFSFAPSIPESNTWRRHVWEP
jgi:hypothetical protein